MARPRCAAPGCRKRLGMHSYMCDCALTFCRRHRLPEAHACTIDYRERDAEADAAALPRVVPVKVPRV